MLDNPLKAQLELEIQQMAELLAQYGALIHRVKDKEPDLIERTALASVLHSFYTGVESMFETIAKQIDHSLPSGQRWHADLLVQMARSTSSRPALTL